jgi:hypothetical protein
MSRVRARTSVPTAAKEREAVPTTAQQVLQEIFGPASTPPPAVVVAALSDIEETVLTGLGITPETEAPEETPVEASEEMPPLFDWFAVVASETQIAKLPAELSGLTVLMQIQVPHPGYVLTFPGAHRKEILQKMGLDLGNDPEEVETNLPGTALLRKRKKNRMVTGEVAEKSIDEMLCSSKEQPVTKDQKFTERAYYLDNKRVQVYGGHPGSGDLKAWTLVLKPFREIVCQKYGLQGLSLVTHTLQKRGVSREDHFHLQLGFLSHTYDWEGFHFIQMEREHLPINLRHYPNTPAGRTALAYKDHRLYAFFTHKYDATYTALVAKALAAYLYHHPDFGPEVAVQYEEAYRKDLAGHVPMADRATEAQLIETLRTANAQIERYQQSIQQYMTQRTQAVSTLNEIREGGGNDKILKAIRLMVGVPGVVSVGTDGSNLLVVTNPITLNYRGRNWQMGAYELLIDMANKGIQARSVDRPGAPYPHPHIDGTNPCFGNMKTMIPKALKQGQYQDLMVLLLAWLGSCTDTDMYRTPGNCLAMASNPDDEGDYEGQAEDADPEDGPDDAFS